MSPDERRTARRIPFHGYINRVQGGLSTVCRAVNLSRTGILFENVTSPRHQDGDIVAVEFQLPTSDRVLVARGRQVRIDGRRMGIRFTSVSPKAQAMIDGYIAAARMAVPAS